MKQYQGAYVTIDGPDGAGKSSQVALLAEATGALITREPGGTQLGAEIRRLILQPATPVDPMAELLLFSADRAQLAAEVLWPNIMAGQSVISDRSVLSLLAYQLEGSGVRLDPGFVLEITRVAMRNLVPDMRIVLDVPLEVATTRLAATGKQPDRFEAEGAAYFERVRLGFLKYAKTLGAVVIDATGTPEKVYAELYRHCGELLTCKRLDG